MATLADEFSADLEDALTVFEQSFRWNGRKYNCAINLQTNSLLTSKSLFGVAGTRTYPARGNLINIDGANYQVVKLQNAALTAFGGGYVEDRPFIDDPSVAGLRIEFNKLVRK